MVKIIGIDLGTTNSCVSWIENGEPVIIVNQEGARVTPSVVAYTSKGEKYVGLQAKRQAVVNPEYTISGIKRLIGKRYTDPDIEELKKSFTCKIVPSENGEAWVEVGGQAYSPSEISAQVIGKLKAAASEYCGQEIKEAVIAVPAYFNDAQRQATRQAAALAGLNVRRIVNEPTLAALAYGYRKKEKGYFVVFDLGGGTFDVSVLEFREGAFHVLATAGDNRLGGSDFDRIIFDKILEKIGQECSHDVARDKMAVQRLWEAAEVAKCELSTLTGTTISLPFLAMTQEGAYHLNFEMTRDELEKWVAPLVERLAAPCKDAMEQAGLTAEDIERVLLVGGMTRMPIVQKTVESLFGNKQSKSLNPDEIVAAGAAVQAGVFEGEVREIVLLDVTPLNLGIRVAGDKVATIIERNSVIPTRASKIFTTTENNQNFVTITVTQGDSPVASKNAILGEFVLTGIPEGPAGQARIEVQFEIDADGVVSVSGVDKKTGIMQAITIHNGMGMTEEELERARVRF